LTERGNSCLRLILGLVQGVTPTNLVQLFRRLALRRARSISIDFDVSGNLLRVNPGVLPQRPANCCHGPARRLGRMRLSTSRSINFSAFFSRRSAASCIGSTLTPPRVRISAAMSSSRFRWRSTRHQPPENAAAGMGDPVVLAWAKRDARILLTFDKDFGELARASVLPSTRTSRLMFCGTALLVSRTILDLPRLSWRH
jgi:hypothetical protein